MLNCTLKTSEFRHVTSSVDSVLRTKVLSVRLPDYNTLNINLHSACTSDSLTILLQTKGKMRSKVSRHIKITPKNGTRRNCRVGRSRRSFSVVRTIFMPLPFLAQKNLNSFPEEFYTNDYYLPTSSVPPIRIKSFS